MRKQIVPMQIIIVDVPLQQVTLRANNTLFTYRHDANTLTFFDPNESDEFDPCDTANIDDTATEHFQICSDEHLAACIKVAIFDHYKFVDQCASFCELTALGYVKTLQVEM